MPKTKKLIAQRRCVACRKVQNKHLMIRIARSPSGEVNIDLTGKAPGRGAYICKDENCLKIEIKKHLINRALKSQIPADLNDRLLEIINANNN